MKSPRSSCLGAEAQFRESDRADTELRGAVFEQACCDPSLATEQNSPCPCPACTAASGERITQIPNALLLRSGDLPTPGAQASAELVRPLVRGLEDDATALSAHQDFALSREPALFREPDCLTAAIFEE